jgi:hypothetical protein
VAELTRWVREGHDEIGSVHQLSCTRRVAGAAREVVLAQLARDVELLAAVAGDIRQVSAIGPASPSASYASLQVQMTSASAATLHWSVAPATRGDTGGIELVLVGERGTATLDQQSGSNQSSPEFILRLSTQDMQATALPEFNAPRAAIRGLATAVELRPPSTEQAARDKRLSGTSPAPGSPLPAASTWPKATQAMEVVDSIELSLQKGRTIDVHQQQLTEQLAFRGTMAAFGCGLLLLGLFAVFVISLFGGLEKAIRQPIFRGWPIVLLGVLCLFLLLQAVPLLAAKTKRPTANDPPRAEE